MNQKLSVSTPVQIKSSDKKASKNLVHAPEHYLEGRTISPICVIEDWDLNHHLACALKYICRAGRKGSETLDIEKAIWYLSRRLVHLEGVSKENPGGCDINTLSQGGYLHGK